MPIHDWTRLEPGDFHHFHQGWVVNLTNELNSGLLPPGYMAMTEQVTGRPIPDVVTLQTRTPKGDPVTCSVIAMYPGGNKPLFNSLVRFTTQPWWKW